MKVIVKHPSTIDEAVDIIIENVLEPEDINNILNSDEDEFCFSAFFGLGLWIRNKWMWGKSHMDTGFRHPDDVSDEILHKLWQKLHERSGRDRIE